MDKNFDFSIIRALRKEHNLTITDMAESSGVSTAVISRIERNQASPELDTLYKIAKVFGLTGTDLLGLAEGRTSQLKKANNTCSGGFKFRRIEYANMDCYYGNAEAGAEISRPEVHRDDYEVCWVLSGKIEIKLPKETHILDVDDSIQFDAIMEHTYKAIDDCIIVISHIRKDKRF